MVFTSDRHYSLYRRFLFWFLSRRKESVFSRNDFSMDSSTSSVVGSAEFSCDKSKSIRAVFMTNGAEITLSDGRTMNLSQAVSADGGRYANSDESFVFWTKGKGAFVNENGTTTYANCIVSNK